MNRGDLLDDRFEIEEFVAAGGMGRVWRARDTRSGARVAVKVLLDGQQNLEPRFEREVEISRALRHPGIVTHVGHGQTPEGRRFLAMEWLEGEDLCDRLARGALPVAGVVALGHRIAQALGVAHARGVVHRDVKPGNIFLVDGDPSRAKLLDFGVARMSAVETETRTGSVVGTPAYMAPEQARATRDIDGRADVFSLGCVLHECLTGVPPFAGSHPVAILAKVLLEPARRVRELRPEVPGKLDDLLARMLSKDPARRPADGTAVADELAGMLDATGATLPPGAMSTRPPGLGETEQRVLSVLLLAERAERADPAAPTLVGARGALGASGGARIEEIARKAGAEVTELADGSWLITAAGRSLATDRARQAARCALALGEVAPQAHLALATGRGVLSAKLPVGEVVDRAAALLCADTDTGTGTHTGTRTDTGTRTGTGTRTDTDTGTGTGTGTGTDTDTDTDTGTGTSTETDTGTTRVRAVERAPVRIDAVTAGLLDARFDVRVGAVGFELFGERPRALVARALLGRVTPCLGRDRELSALQGLYDECVRDSVPRLGLVTGPPGIGKSRLCLELLDRLREGDAPPEVWAASGDPVGAGSPFGLVTQLVRQAAGLAGGERPRARRERLLARAARHLDGAAARRVAEFFGELVEAGFGEEQSVELAAARQSAVVMGDQILEAWLAFLGAECAAQPLVIVLEDLHWGDVPSVRALATALRVLEQAPLLVLCAARPEAARLFPTLWAHEPLLEMRLGELSPRHAERLVQVALGDGADAAAVARIVERAAGNAFWIEELVRSHAGGRDAGDLPETVLAMIQARLETLATESRRVLRAASVFGRSFWERGVLELCGGHEAAPEVRDGITELVDREVVARSAESRLAGEAELVFRHALVREAAYAMLTDADRSLGHRLAGVWLESMGETDAMVLAEHHQAGGDLTAAVAWYHRAASQALEGNDLAAAVARAQRGLACGASGRKRAALLLVQAEAQRWRGELAEAVEAATLAMTQLERGSAEWCTGVVEVTVAGGMRGLLPRLVTLADEVAALLDSMLAGDERAPPTDRGDSPVAPPSRSLVGARVVAAARLAIQLFMMGRLDLGDALLGRIDRAAADLGDARPEVTARVHQAHAARVMRGGQPQGYLRLTVRTVADLERAGDRRAASAQRSNLGHALNELGQYARAEATLRQVLDVAERFGLPSLLATAQNNLGVALAGQGKLEEARLLEETAVRTCRAVGDRRTEGSSRVYLASILARLGDLESAEREAREAVAQLEVAPPRRAAAWATLAEVLLEAGKTADGLEAAEAGMETMRSLGRLEEGELQVRLAYALACRDAGRTDAAREALATAHARLVERAASIHDDDLRQSFLGDVREHARILELSRAWSAHPDSQP